METADFVMGLLLIIALLFLGFMCIGGAYQAGYKEGQVNALNDKYEYKLVKKENSSSDWKKVEAYSLKKEVK